MITTRPRPSKKVFELIADLIDLLPNAFYYPRDKFHVKEICGWAHKKSFTHVIVLGEKSKKVNRMLVSHLPTGPTALFKLTTVVLERALQRRGNKTSHTPEILLNNFNTRLGHRVGRFLGSFFPHRPDFTGRQVRACVSVYAVRCACVRVCVVRREGGRDRGRERGRRMREEDEGGGGARVKGGKFRFSWRMRLRGAE